MTAETATPQAHEASVRFDFQISLDAEDIAQAYPLLAIDLLAIGATDKKRAIRIQIWSRSVDIEGQCQVYVDIDKGKGQNAEGISMLDFGVDDLTDVPAASIIFNEIVHDYDNTPRCCFDVSGQAVELTTRLIRYAWFRVAALAQPSIDPYQEVYG